MSSAEQRIEEGLRRIQADMSTIVAADGDPYEAAWRIWGEAMSAASESHDIMWPLWLLWGALTDWVEVKPDDALVARETMRRAAAEWLALPHEAGPRAAYFDRWLYHEMGYEHPSGASSDGA